MRLSKRKPLWNLWKSSSTQLKTQPSKPLWERNGLNISRFELFRHVSYVGTHREKKNLRESRTITLQQSLLRLAVTEKTPDNCFKTSTVANMLRGDASAQSSDTMAPWRLTMTLHKLYLRASLTLTGVLLHTKRLPNRTLLFSNYFR